MFKSYLPRTAAASLIVALTAGGVLAAGSHDGGHGHGGGAIHGQPGEASAASRTVEVEMHDNYYEPETITVNAGETVRFRIHNAGSLVHEFAIATDAMHAEHQEEMMMMVEHGVLEGDRINWSAAQEMQDAMGHGMHDDPNSALLEPGESEEIVWTFPEDATVNLEFACNVPGHYESGMVGEFATPEGS